MSKYIGPALPPHLKHLMETAAEDESPPQESNIDEDVLVLQDSNGSLSGDDSIGPALPPGFLANQRAANSPSVPDQSPESSSFGPTLPPGFLANQRAAIGPSLPDNESSEEDSFGPALPPGFQAGSSNSDVLRAAIGPALPPRFCLAEEDESDEDVVGPMPLPDDSQPSTVEYLQRQMERRALKMKRKLKGEDEDDSKTTKRETWMLELPPDRASEFGLGPRQFRAKAKQELGDRTVWTDTPDERIRKQNGPGEADTSNLAEMQLKAIADRDKAMEKFTEKHNKKKRKESLVDMHQKKLKKKKKKEEEERKGKRVERRPFDRDVDLQANRFDEAQKKAILRKAQLLDDRFSRGKSKFL